MSFERRLSYESHGKHLGLTGRIVLLTVIPALIIVLVLYFVFSITMIQAHQFRFRYIAKAMHIARIVNEAPNNFIAPDIQSDLLDLANFKAVIVNDGKSRIVLTQSDKFLNISEVLDLRTANWSSRVLSAIQTLAFKKSEVIKVIGAVPNAESVEVILDRKFIRLAMLRYTRQFVQLMFVILALVSIGGYVTLRFILVRPLQRMTQNMASFGHRPEDVSLIWQPSERVDEIGLAEHALADMETSLSAELHQKRRMAELGQSVSKINHELRNLLTSAYLISEQMEQAKDSTMQRALPRLGETLDRAIAFCEATLAYGRVQEPSPKKETVRLNDMMDDLRDLAEKNGRIFVQFESDIPDKLTVEADRDQLSRAFANIVRNAVQAFLAGNDGQHDTVPKIRFSANEDDGNICVVIEDNGPGLPEKIKKDPFTAFHGTTKAGGSGLGLAISAELVQLQGGFLTYEDTQKGTRFHFTFPLAQSQMAQN